jgi:AcrR family transcriptional regulator
MQPRRTAAKTPKRRIEGTARRAQILRVAGDMFAKDGIEATSMRRIAAKAGVTATLLYKHFADKDALLFAIGEGFFQKLATDLDQSGALNERDPVARLRAQMKAYVRCGIANPREYHLTFMTALPQLRRDQKLKTFRERTRRGEAIPAAEITLGMKCFARLEQAVVDIVDAKLTRTKDVAALAECVWAAGHGLVSLIITHRDFGFTDVDELIATSTDLMLHGVLKS